jgi:tRNA pseudouridine55 synthase
MDGLIVVDKPAGWTSHDVVAKLRGILGEKRIGHSGTLDPSATGILLIGIGKFTRFLRYLTDLSKSYECEIVFGTTTSTLDADGEIIGKFEMNFSASEAAAAAEKLTGEIMQTPPMFSAVQQEGKRLYELAREGKNVDRKPRAVTVHQFQLMATDDRLVYSARIHCSSGTYVRVLGADLGELLGGGAHIRNLRRTSIGSFYEQDSHRLNDINKDTIVLSSSEALRDYEAAELDDGQILALRQGKQVELGSDFEILRAIDRDGELVAVVKRAENGYKPDTVMSY